MKAQPHADSHLPQEENCAFQLFPITIAFLSLMFSMLISKLLMKEPLLYDPHCRNLLRLIALSP